MGLLLDGKPVLPKLYRKIAVLGGKTQQRIDNELAAERSKDEMEVAAAALAANAANAAAANAAAANAAAAMANAAAAMGMGGGRRLQSPDTTTPHVQQMIESPEFQEQLRSNLGVDGADAVVSNVTQGAVPAAAAARVTVQAGGAVVIKSGGTLTIGGDAAL